MIRLGMRNCSKFGERKGDVPQAVAISINCHRRLELAEMDGRESVRRDKCVWEKGGGLYLGHFTNLSQNVDISPISTYFMDISQIAPMSKKNSRKLYTPLISTLITTCKHVNKGVHARRN